MKFLDECKIYIRSGNGGGGAVSFRKRTGGKVEVNVLPAPALAAE